VVAPSPKAGFTLIEATISLLLSSVLVILVGTTFLIQNQYYSSQLQMTGVHDNARSATELIASEVRSVMAGGVKVAGSHTLTVRGPMMLASVCATSGVSVSVYSDGGSSQVDTLEFAGVALRDTTTGSWSYVNTTWSNVKGTGGTPAADCAGNGADTTAVSGQFYSLKNLSGLFGSSPVLGDLIMLFSESTFVFQTSEMDSTTVGLFRGIYGDPLTEFATGMDTTAAFQFRTGGATYHDTVLAASLANIDVVRIIAEARKRAETGGESDVTFGWSTNIALRNVRDDG
jgi:Tfp pilus assembly protein PilW